ncbi:MAG: radical SAM protein [Candidatus Bathyarchaeota archaeon]|nr:radical SAM protein [Candidatus Bathyarchaeum sp.]
MSNQILLRGNGDFTKEQFEQVLKANDEKHMMLSLGLTTSPGCNMRCVFCYSDSGTKEAGNKIKDIMTLKDFEKAITESAKMGAQSVILVGIGETLMDNKIRQIIEMVSSNGMYPLVFTNGTALDKDMVQFLHKNRATIYLSLNAVDEKIFDKISGSKGLFAKVMEGIDNCLEAGFGKIMEHNGHQVTDFAVNTMVMKENMDNIDAIKQFCEERNILFTCRLPEKLGTAKESWDALIAGGPEDEQKMKEIAMKHSLGGEVFRTDYGCLFWVAGVLLGVDGKARLCYSLNNKKDFGNIKTDSMLEIIQKKNVAYKPTMDYFCPIHAEMVNP